MRACTLAFFLDLESDWLFFFRIDRWGKEGEEGGRRVFFFRLQQNDNVLFRFIIFYILL
jgi:hypothetical protein